MRSRSRILKSIAIQISAWLPVILWAVLIFRFSSGKIPVASMVYWQDFAVKKTGHVLLFGAMAFLLYRALRINGVDKKNSAILSATLSMFYGATDEFHQMFTQGRESRVRDVFIDGLGASFVSAVLYYMPAKVNTKFEKLFKSLNLQ